jgi:outer membrane protein assembly factor BamB
MQNLRNLTVGLAALTLAPGAAAQLEGPAPLAWRFIQPTEVGPGGSPLVLGERIFQSVGGRVFCIDKETGNLKYRFPAIDPIPGIFRTSPVAVGNVIAVAGDNRVVYGFDAESGELKWSFNLSAGSFGQPVAVGNMVVVAQSDNKLVAIKAENGEAAWANPFNVLDGINGSPAAYQNSVVFFTNRNELVSLNATNLRYDWRRRLTQVAPNSTPTVFGEDVYLNSGPYLISINAGTGFARWQISTGTQLAHAPAASAAGIAVVSRDGKMMVFDPVSRSAITQKPIEIGSLAVAQPTPSGNLFVVPTTVGGLALVDPKKGQVVWNYLIRPIGGIEDQPSNNNQPGGGMGGPGGRPGGLGGPGGGSQGGPGGGAGRGGNQGNNQSSERVLTIPPAAPAVMTGNTLLVPARDGSLLAFDAQIGVDLTPPKVEMIFPNSGDQVSPQPPLLLVFRLQDIASGVKEDTLKVSIGDQVLDHTLQRDGLVVVRFTQTGKNRTLSDGRKEIVVTVSDWLGNVAKQTYALTIDNTLPPIKLPGTENDANQPGGLGGPGGRGGRGGRGGNGGDNR